VLSLGAQCLMLGGPGIARMLGAKPSKDAHLLKLARQAAEAVGVPPPDEVYEVDKKEPNAFAASGVLSSQPTAIAVTTGLRSILSDDELSAVLAHEMGHLAHRDVARNMHVAIATAGFGGVFEAGRLLLRSSSSSSSSSSRRSKKDKKDSDGSVAAVGMGLMAGGLALQGVAHFLRLAASRDAELHADRAAAEAFGAESLVTALRKINGHAACTPADMRHSTMGRVMAHAMISDGYTTPTTRAASSALSSKSASWPWHKRVGSTLGAALRTHPTLDTRIAALEEAVESGLVPARMQGKRGGWW